MSTDNDEPMESDVSMQPEESLNLDEPVMSEPAPDQDPDTQYVRLRRSHIYLALIPIATLVGFGAGYLVWGQDAAQDVAAAPDPIAQDVATVNQDVAAAAQASRLEVDPGGDPSLGPVDAPVTIVEFSDFNCPHCQNWHREVSEELLSTYPNEVRFVYKDFPVVGGGRVGFLGAQAAHCAEEQSAYWDYHNALFSGAYTLDSPGVDQIAVDLGLELEPFKECMVEARYAEEVRDDFNYGVSLGVSSTPTFFINGIPLVGAQPLVNFAQIIDGELDK
jgi:protein-disulfide isomerase